MLDLGLKHQVQCFLFMSSSGTVYGSPELRSISETYPNFLVRSYGIHKMAIEKYLHLYHQLYGPNYVVLQVENPWRPG